MLNCSSAKNLTTWMLSLLDWVCSLVTDQLAIFVWVFFWALFYGHSFTNLMLSWLLRICNKTWSWDVSVLILLQYSNDHVGPLHFYVNFRMIRLQNWHLSNAECSYLWTWLPFHLLRALIALLVYCRFPHIHPVQIFLRLITKSSFCALISNYDIHCWSIEKQWTCVY
jgi:hypothetical protein